MYSSDFYDYSQALAVRSADRLLPLVVRHFQPTSIVDFGCGRGAWLGAWKKLGMGSLGLLGIESEQMTGQPLLIDERQMVFHDLTEPIDLQRRFDLVQSLEVAEHILPAAAETFIESLTRHGDVILFSAAPPGQGGLQHVNEQPYEYWRNLFRRRGFVAVDLIRREILGDRLICRWYRYNVLVYIQERVLDDLADDIEQHIVQDGVIVEDLSPSLYKLRKRLLRLLPVAAINVLANINMHLAQALRR